MASVAEAAPANVPVNPGDYKRIVALAEKVGSPVELGFAELQGLAETHELSAAQHAQLAALLPCLIAAVTQVLTRCPTDAEAFVVEHILGTRCSVGEIGNAQVLKTFKSRQPPVRPRPDDDGVGGVEQLRYPEPSKLA